MTNDPLFSEKDLKSLPLGFQFLVNHQHSENKDFSEKEILEKAKVLAIDAYQTRRQSPRMCWKPISKIILL
jgi:hypothetical protein